MKKFALKQDKGYALLAGVLIAAFLGIILAAAMVKANTQLKLIHQRQALQEAFYAAEAGLERSIFELRQDPAWRPGEGGYPSQIDTRLNRIPEDDSTTLGFFSLQIHDAPLFNGWNTLWVRSQGQDAKKEIARVLVARVLIDNPSRFLMSTLGDLRIISGAVIHADILGKDIFFDVNESLDSPEKDIAVNGDVYYLRSVNGIDNPAVHVSAESSVEKFPSITFAGVDLDRYRNIASGLSESGEGIFSEDSMTIDLSDLSSISEHVDEEIYPKIIFSEGDIFLKGQYPVSMLIVAAGNIYLDGSIEPGDDPESLPQLGIFAGKDIIIPEDAETRGGDLSVEAFLLADGQGDDAQGVFIANGDKSTKGTFTFNGAIAVRGEGGRTGIDLNVFSNRAYNFNPELTNHRKIPFSPFIVNIMDWREISVHDPFPPA